MERFYRSRLITIIIENYCGTHCFLIKLYLMLALMILV